MQATKVQRRFVTSMEKNISDPKKALGLFTFVYSTAKNAVQHKKKTLSNGLIRRTHLYSAQGTVCPRSSDPLSIVRY